MIPDDPGQDDLVLGTDGCGILIGGTGKGLHIFSQISKLHHLVHHAVFGAEKRGGGVLIFPGQFVHLLHHRPKVPARLFLLEQAPGIGGHGSRGFGPVFSGFSPAR